MLQQKIHNLEKTSLTCYYNVFHCLIWNYLDPVLLDLIPNKIDFSSRV